MTAFSKKISFASIARAKIRKEATFSSQLHYVAIKQLLRTQLCAKLLSQVQYNGVERKSFMIASGVTFVYAGVFSNRGAPARERGRDHGSEISILHETELRSSEVRIVRAYHRQATLHLIHTASRRRKFKVPKARARACARSGAAAQRFGSKSPCELRRA